MMLEASATKTRNTYNISFERNHIKSLRESANDKKDKVKQDMDEIETINIELEHRVKSSTSASRSQPSGNPKNNRILRPPSSNISSSKSTITNITEPNQSCGSNASDVPSSSSLVDFRIGNDQIAKIMGYGNYQLGNVTISQVYYVEGLGHNLFSVRQLCDSNLKAPSNKAFRIYNRRTRLTIETIHVTFDKLTAMDSEQFSSGPRPQLMNPATLSSGLMPNPPSPTPVASLVPAVVALVPVDSTSTPSSTLVDQDAPSPSTSQTPQETQALVLSFGVKEENHDIEVAHMDNDQYFGIPILERSFEESSSQVVILNNVHSVNQPPEHISKWTKYHPIDNVIGDPSRPVSTRHQIKNESMFCYFDAFLSSIEPKSYKEAL
ncbi:hypothetical protein Tco_1541835 [Tanacetum coccineum]